MVIAELDFSAILIGISPRLLCVHLPAREAWYSSTRLGGVQMWPSICCYLF